jgi:hypothetical protein
MRILIYLALLLVATGTALRFGKREEKLAALILLVGNFGSVAIEVLGSPHAFSTPSLVYFCFDALLAGALCLLAVRRPAWLTITVAAWQINGTLAHLVKMAVPDTVAISYAVLLKFWGWPMVIALLMARFVPQMQTRLRSRHWPFTSKV